MQLPLHILLENHFGDLNENQEEMLGAARTAAEAADVRIRQVQRLLALERGAVPMLPRPIGVAELLRPALAIAEARAAKRDAALRAVLAATAPRVLVDPVHAQDAVTMALSELVERVPAGRELTVEATESSDGTVRVVAAGAEPAPRAVARDAARRTTLSGRRAALPRGRRRPHASSSPPSRSAARAPDRPRRGPRAPALACRP